MKAMAVDHKRNIKKKASEVYVVYMYHWTCSLTTFQPAFRKCFYFGNGVTFFYIFQQKNKSKKYHYYLNRTCENTAHFENISASLAHEFLLPSLPTQCEIVCEELEYINEQHQQLSSAFAAQSAELARVEGEARETRERLALRETELARLRQKKERRASVSKVDLFSTCIIMCTCTCTVHNNMLGTNLKNLDRFKTVGRSAGCSSRVAPRG